MEKKILAKLKDSQTDKTQFLILLKKLHTQINNANYPQFVIEELYKMIESEHVFQLLIIQLLFNKAMQQTSLYSFLEQKFVKESDPKSLFPYEFINYTLNQFGIMNDGVIDRIISQDELLITLLERIQKRNLQHSEEILTIVLQKLSVNQSLLFNKFPYRSLKYVTFNSTQAIQQALNLVLRSSQRSYDKQNFIFILIICSVEILSLNARFVKYIQIYFFKDKLKQSIKVKINLDSSTLHFIVLISKNHVPSQTYYLTLNWLIKSQGNVFYQDLISNQLNSDRFKKSLRQSQHEMIFLLIYVISDYILQRHETSSITNQNLREVLKDLKSIQSSSNIYQYINQMSLRDSTDLNKYLNIEDIKPLNDLAKFIPLIRIIQKSQRETDQIEKMVEFFFSRAQLNEFEIYSVRVILNLAIKDNNLFNKIIEIILKNQVNPSLSLIQECLIVKLNQSSPFEYQQLIKVLITFAAKPNLQRNNKFIEYLIQNQNCQVCIILLKMILILD